MMSRPRHSFLSNGCPQSISKPNKNQSSKDDNSSYNHPELVRLFHLHHHRAHHFVFENSGVFPARHGINAPIDILSRTGGEGEEGLGGVPLESPSGRARARAQRGGKSKFEVDTRRARQHRNRRHCGDEFSRALKKAPFVEQCGFRFRDYFASPKKAEGGGGGN